ncbi:hypothetical protein F0562_022551 [Nyssa sinensis]|uniref:PHD-type domain-containing protein n=1 Tax=Nyssa sinensis TaxID=561372 RepID=A0A5J5BNX8_9ASTE|nr:hypothetical protein F0562_022551 [Nyssa sinensis]
MRRVTADQYDFLTFPAAADAVSGRPFRSSVQCFLSRHARSTFPPSLFPSFMTWQILFRIDDLVAEEDGGPAVVALDIVEEDVTRSRSVYCDQCRIIGWSGHPVCQRRYHFIIRKDNINNGTLLQEEDEEEEKGYQKACRTCGNLLHLSYSRCKSCGNVITADDIEDWVYHQFEDNTHLLHAVVHSNGYAHLLTLNGREGGSKVLSGRDIMNFWDRLCTILQVRKVSVMDVSKKYGMEYRLLHTITNGHPWYGDWGYEFGSGSYALTLDSYQNAVSTLSSIPLSLFSFQCRKPQTHLQAVIAFYQSISECELVSIRDLFSFMLKLIDQEIHRSFKAATCEKSKPRTTNVLCAWTRNDIERVEQAMVKVLLAAANDASWVPRRALKGALCKAASPELLDYCLKHLEGKIATNGLSLTGVVSNENGSNSNYPSKEHLIRDLKFLYDSILHPQTMASYRPQATRELVDDSATKLLDCKQFVKDFKLDKMAATNPFAIHLWCHLELSDHPKDDPIPPPELVVLPQNASVADLKVEAAKAFQDVYAMFKRFEIDELLGYGPLDDSMTLKILVGSTGSIRVRGRCLRTHGLSRFRMERGTENWTVACMCGAKDDDGERMLACDTCGIWMHTRCAGIDNYDAIPVKFICTGCLNSYRTVSNKVAQSSEEVDRFLPSAGTCRDEAATANGPRVGCNLPMTFGVR